MKVSCIIPVYNTHKYLVKCIDSVLGQTYHDIEIVLVNDCSTDNSADICRRYASQYPDKIHFIDKPRNEGVDRARFTALDYVLCSNSTGGVTFIDSDDYINSDAIYRLVDEMQRTNADIVEMGFNRFFGPISRPSQTLTPSCVISQPELFEDYFISFFGINRLGVNLWGKLYKNEVLCRASLQPSDFKMGEDLIFNMRLFPLVKRYSVIDYRGYNYRIGGLTSTFNPTFWPDLKRQYLVKRDFARAHNYAKAYRPLYIELKNIFLTAITLRIEFLRESDEELHTWVYTELGDTLLWADIRDAASHEPNHVFTEIARQDASALISRARQLVHDSRWRRRFIKVIRMLFK